LARAGRLAIIRRMSDHQDSSAPPDHKGMMLGAALIATTGWIGLWLLVTTTLPTAFPRWLFFVFLYLAVTGTVLPFVRFLNMRFTREDRWPSSGVILRQSVWMGLFVVACAWLQIPRVLNPVIAAFLALSLIVVEFFLRVRETDQSES
jgi:heme/copper-type cytochrome/quinol oxidase subunit 4